MAALKFRCWIFPVSLKVLLKAKEEEDKSSVLLRFDRLPSMAHEYLLTVAALDKRHDSHDFRCHQAR